MVFILEHQGNIIPYFPNFLQVIESTKRTDNMASKKNKEMLKAESLNRLMITSPYFQVF